MSSLPPTGGPHGPGILVRRSVLLTLCAGLLVAGFLLWQQNQRPGETGQDLAAVPSSPVVRKVETGGDAPPGARPQRVVRSRVAEVGAPDGQPVKTVESNLELLGPLAPGESMDSWLNTVLQAVLKTPVERARSWRRAAEAGDAAAAFRQHVLAMLCLYGPRHGWQLDQRLDDLRDRLDKLEELDETQANQQVEYIQRELREAQATHALCAHLDPELDLRVEALEWLETAAELGHRGAQRFYPYFGRSLLLSFEGGLAFEQPGLVEEFQLRARRYGESLLATGHPEGYLAMSELYFDGSAYPRDYVRSYAYALAAEWLYGGQENRVTQLRLRLLDGRISPEGKEQAMTLVAELLAQRP